MPHPQVPPTLITHSVSLSEGLCFVLMLCFILKLSYLSLSSYIHSWYALLVVLELLACSQAFSFVLRFPGMF
ncbi:hypothetical protein BDQ17DRAFT_1382589 [Cyathus striatus]|nr:hypothetical protein BDQ17DRAFT_1382589 [Cyathus striatus]